MRYSAIPGDGMSTVCRLRPALGTLVDVRVEGLPEPEALRAINSAFAEVAQIHRLMSFHEPDSDLSRVHRARVGTRVSVDARTRQVLACALRIAQESNGCFDPTIAAEQVVRGYLPAPDSAFTPDPVANWRDIELDEDGVRLRKPLWIDLGGIAKGYAVDRAVAVLLDARAEQACVNAGGDLRVAGVRAERVHVRGARGAIVAAVELSDAAIASSTSALAGAIPAHVDGADRRAIAGGTTVSIVAPNCMLADALTKVVLAQGAASASTLAMFGANACLHDARRGSRTLGLAA
jgi:thiamine biosynthesis lipoprotein